MFSDFEECEQYKFIQCKNQKIIMQLKPNKNYRVEEIQKKALMRWNKRFSKYPIEVEFVDKFDIDPKSGKFKNIERISRP